MEEIPLYSIGGGNRNGLAHLPPTGEIPSIRKACALRWFDRVNPASTAIQHNAFLIFLLGERKSLPIGAKAGVVAYEIVLGDAQVMCHGCNFRWSNANITRPFAASGTALANIIHAGL